jgi:hypothetical protein
MIASRLVAPVVGVSLSIVVLAGCGVFSGSGQPASTPASHATSVQQQARVVWLDYARCVRAHGYRDFPDPQVDSQGRVSLPQSPQIKAAAQQAQGACGSILGRLPASVTGATPVTAAQLRQERLFAGCMRAHGLPDWPDPRPDGSFPVANTLYVGDGKSGPVQAGLQACRQYETFGGIRTS